MKRRRRPREWIRVQVGRLGEFLIPIDHQDKLDRAFEMWDDFWLRVSCKVNPHQHCVYCMFQYWTWVPWRRWHCSPECEFRDRADQAAWSTDSGPVFP